MNKKNLVSIFNYVLSWIMYWIVFVHLLFDKKSQKKFRNLKRTLIILKLIKNAKDNHKTLYYVYKIKRTP